MAALGDWLVETHVSEAIFQATEACRQLCFVKVVFANFVVGFAVDACHGERHSEFVRGGPAEQALSSRGNAGITLAHLELAKVMSESATDANLRTICMLRSLGKKWMARQSKELV